MQPATKSSPVFFRSEEGPGGGSPGSRGNRQGLLFAFATDIYHMFMKKRMELQDPDLRKP